MNTGFEPRDQMLRYMRAQLIGPAGGPGETLFELPTDRYAAGILFPTGTEFADAPAGSGAAGEDPLAQTTRYFPSAAGLSFLAAQGSAFEVTLGAARYRGETVEVPPRSDDDGLDDDAPDAETREEPSRKKRTRRLWHEEAIGTGTAPHLIHARVGATRATLLDGAAYLHVEGRASGDEVLMTVALVNAVDQADLPPARGKQVPSKRTVAEHCLYQVGLLIESPTPVLPYPTAGAGLGDLEDAELAFQYRTRPVYAVGHGVSADWSVSDAGTRLSTEFLPASLVRSIRYDRPGDDPDAWRYDGSILELDRLASLAEPASVLEPFVGAYAAWVTRQRDEVEAEVSPAHRQTVDAIARKQSAALERMEDAVRLLTSDPVALTAFRLACRTMADQMRRPGAAKRLDKPPALRPFQLAFFLLVLPGLADRTRDDHDVVDLLWFPTGGGKTEAYLLISAFEVFRRRLVTGGDDDGVVVLSRYTLRLLTTQQFQRTVAMACAADLIRRADVDHLGAKPISVGLWVGGSHSPTNYKQALEEWARRTGRRIEVVEAENGFEALRELPRAPFELVLTDVNMPVLSGLELIRMIRSRPEQAGLPVVAVSTERDAEDAARARKAGADGYLGKPFDAETLDRVLEEVLAARAPEDS